MEETVESKLLAPVDAEISARIAWLIQLRWLAVVGTLIAITVANALLPRGLPVVPLVAIAAFIGLYNILFYVYSYALRLEQDEARRWKRSVYFTYVQIMMDLICLTVLLHFAGGVESPIWILYVLHIIIASILLSQLAAFFYAGLTIIFFGTVIGLEYAGFIEHVHLSGVVHPDQYRQESYLLAVFAVFVATIFFSTSMATTIMARLRQRDRELLQANQRNAERAQELAELNERLKAVDEERRAFIRMVTHELRAPIAAIQSYINLILGGYVPPERQPEILGRANKRAAEELDRINDLLVLSQIQDKRAAATAVDLGEVAGHVLELLRGAAEEKKLTLIAQLGPNVPSILANRDQIAHLWTNLISNAIKYTPAGGKVTVTLTHTPALIIGRVQDTGIGISAADQEKIFQEFYRTEEAKKTEQHGTGLGLSIVRRIVERLGGRIWVRSAAGQGATFTFVFPQAGVSAEQFQQAVQALKQEKA